MIIVPSFYKKFKCSSSECNDTCCKNWSIYLDKKSLEALDSFNKQYKGVIGDNIVKREEHTVIKMEKGVCPFLNTNKLCQLQLLGGEEYLPYTCRIYPRKEVCLRDDTIKYSLSLSCEQSVATVLNYFNLTEMIIEKEPFLKQNEWLNNVIIDSNIQKKLLEEDEMIALFRTMDIIDQELLQISYYDNIDKGLSLNEIKLLVGYYVWTYYDGINFETTKTISKYMVSLFDCFIKKTSNDFYNKLAIIHKLAREIEHSDKNIKKILKSNK